MSDFPNSGILSPNRFKKAGTKQPDMKGRAASTCVHCKKETEFELAGWNRGDKTQFVLTEKSEADRKKAAWKANRDGTATSEAQEQEQPNSEHEDVPF